MADAPQIHPLRQRMIEDMSMRGLAAATQRNYLRVVRACAKHAGKSPGDRTFDDARALRLEVADIFRDLGRSYRRTHARRLSFAQKRVMEAIETCRTAALGGHVSRCEDCAHIDVGTIHAATATAPNARRRPPMIGWKRGAPSSCLSLIITSSSHCPRRSPTSPTPTRR